MPPCRQSPRRFQYGIALLDVMLALLVLGPGVIAIARLQGVVMRDDGHAKAKAIAVQLAREKLDDLRQYAQLAAGGPGIYGYDEIGSNSGGRENVDGSLVFAASSTTLSDTLYTRTWLSAAYSWCSAGAAPVSGICSGASRPGFKQVQVTLTWTTIDGTAQTLMLETSIAAIDPALASMALIRRPSLLPPRVQAK